MADTRVVAFEANPYTFERFTKKVDYRECGVDYRNVALSDGGAAKVTMNVRKAEGGGPSADGQASLLRRQDYEPGHLKVEVEASTLDAIRDEFDAATCALWVDVEGAIESVLAGATKMLAVASLMFVEVEEREYWPSQWLRSEVDSRLFDAGLLAVARDFQSVYQHNVLYVRRELRETEFYRRMLPEYFSRIGNPPVAQPVVRPRTPFIRRIGRGAKKLFVFRS